VGARRSTGVSDLAAGILFCLLSASAFSLQGVFARYAYEGGGSTPMVGGVRFSLAAILLWAYVLWRRRRERFAIVPSRRIAIRLLLLGAVGYFVGSFTYLAAVTTISVSLAGLLLYIYPAVATALAIALQRERGSTPLFAGMALALAGVAITLGAPLLEHGFSPDPRGVVLVLVSAVLYAAYIVGSESVLRGVHTMVALTYICSGASASYIVLIGLTRTFTPGMSIGAWSATGGMAVISTVVAAGAFLAGLRRLGPARAATLSTLEPLVTVVIAFYLLGETLRPVQLAGGLVILAGVVVVVRERSEADEVPAT
jgi:drug/metabolite transporter (DMT)-like permease